MSERQPDDDVLFTERVARALGAPERFGDEFEASLVAAIRADRPLRSTLIRRPRPFTRSWWMTPVTLRFSPLAGFAVAAALAPLAVAGLVSFTARRPDAPARVTAAAVVTDTVTLVRFVFVGQATSVALVGDFNAWGARPTVLAQGASGAWTATIPLPNGRHEYAFIIDGKRWVPDPLAPASSDDFDTKSSVITVGT